MLIGLVMSLGCSAFAIAGNWPAWRGPAGNGVAEEPELPIEFSPTKNVTWVTPLPGSGNSTPIVWDEHVFVTCPIDSGKVRFAKAGAIC